MDIQTLSIVTCVTAATMAVTLGAMQRFSPDDECLKDWAGAGLCFLLNSLVGVVAGSQHPPFWLIAVANASTFAAELLLLTGVRLYLGLSSWRRFALGLSVVLGVLNALPAFHANLELRLLVGWSVIAATNIAVAGLILRSPRHRSRPALAGLALVDVLSALQQLLRLGLLVSAHLHGQPVDLSSGIMTAGRLLMFVFILLTTMLCALLVIQDKVQALQRHADLDPMTGWLNRRTLAQVLAAEFERARRTGFGFHLVTFDIDHFKAINDRHGHAVGDQAICHVTEQVAQELRGYDHKFRVGGEEFVVCVPAQGADAASQVAERLRRCIECRPLPAVTGPIAITVSVGHGAGRAEDPGWEAVLERADQALYRAKQSGRNRVVAAG